MPIEGENQPIAMPPNKPNSKTKRRLIILLVAMIVSLAGLVGIYVQLKRHFSPERVTALAISTVLAAFMAGLALGSYCFGPLADRTRSPLRLYACLEALIGLYTLVLPFVPPLLESAYPALHGALGGSFAAISLANIAS